MDFESEQVEDAVSGIVQVANQELQRNIGELAIDSLFRTVDVTNAETNNIPDDHKYSTIEIVKYGVNMAYIPDELEENNTAECEHPTKSVIQRIFTNIQRNQVENILETLLPEHNEDIGKPIDEGEVFPKQLLRLDDATTLTDAVESHTTTTDTDGLVSTQELEVLFETAKERIGTEYEPDTILISETDAAALGLEDGDVVSDASVLVDSSQTLSAGSAIVVDTDVFGYRALRTEPTVNTYKSYNQDISDIINIQPYFRLGYGVTRPDAACVVSQDDIKE